MITKKPQLTSRQRHVCQYLGFAASSLRDDHVADADRCLREAMKSVWAMKPTDRKLRALQMATVLADIIWERQKESMADLPFDLIPQSSG